MHDFPAVPADCDFVLAVDSVDLALDHAGVEQGVNEEVGENLKSLQNLVVVYLEVVVGLLDPGVGVGHSPVLGDELLEVAFLGVSVRALEEHVLEEMRKAREGVWF